MLLVGWLTRLAEPWAWVVGLAMGATLAPAKLEDSSVDWASVEHAIASAEAEVVPDGQLALPSERASVRQHPRLKNAKRTPSVSKTPSLRVPAATILRLSKVAAPPASRFVERTGQRPAGLQLAGVTALGIGVRDGDVLTHVAGAPVTSRAFVVSTVLKLRARKAPVITGEFWRGQQRWLYAVEMPYLTPQPPTAAPTAAPTADTPTPPPPKKPTTP